MPSNKGPTPRPTGQFQRLLTRAEAITLLGMVLSISSLFLAWPVPIAAPIGAPALVINLTRTGGAIPEVRWPVTIAAILSGLLLAFPPAPRSRMPMTFVQALCGIVCFVIALLHFRLLPGPVIELLGGLLLTFGAVDRLNQPVASGK